MMKRLEKTIYIFVIILCFIVHPLYGQEKSGIKLSNGVLWVNVSDEYKLCVYQAYENASESLKNILQENKPENWCVVIDIDDTALSTIQYEVLLESKGEEYSDETWIEWAVKDEGTPLPGSVEFTRLVKELGGRVVFITNTQGVLKEVTLDKLNNCGFSFDVCIFREGPYKDDKYKHQKKIRNYSIYPVLLL